jgi:adenylate cyclase
VRHYVEHAGHRWEIDVFEGDNAGLVVAEVELQGVDEPFQRPAWIGDEVSNDPRYYNVSLVRHPYKDW